MVANDPLDSASEMDSAVFSVIESFQDFHLSPSTVLQEILAVIDQLEKIDPASDPNRALALAEELSSYEECIEIVASGVANLNKHTNPRTADRVYPLQGVLDVIQGFKEFDPAAVGELVARLSLLSEGIREMESLLDEISSMEVLDEFLVVLESVVGLDIRADPQLAAEKLTKLTSFLDGLKQFQSIRKRIAALSNTPDGVEPEPLPAAETNV